MIYGKIAILLILIFTLLSLFTSCTQQNNEKKASVKSEKITDKSIFADTMVEMNWEQVKKEAENKAIVLFPIAVVEEHGPHMDLSPDIYLTYKGCVKIKQSLEKKGIHAVIAPPYYWGINVATGGFPGSFTTKPETFKAVLYDSVQCLKTWGFTQVFYINYHGDPTHRFVLESSASEIKESLNIDIVDLQSLYINVENNPSLPSPREGKFSPDYHAGADETSWMWSLYPDKVNAEAAKKQKPQSDFYPMGYVGDPASFDLEDGNKFIDTYIEMDALKIEAYIKQQKK